MAKKKKIRAEFRKNRLPRARFADWTRRYATQDADAEAPANSERLSGKGELTRKRTIIADEHAPADPLAALEVDVAACRPGRVLAVHGLTSTVEADDGAIYRCATRRILKTLSTDLRQVVVTGDRVMFRPAHRDEGLIERVEPRRGVINRASRGRQHILAANIDQLLIVASAAEPAIKPHLIDRLLVSAEKDGIRPVVCINKVDLLDPAALQPLVGVYSQMGYHVLLLSAKTGQGVERLRRLLDGQQSAVAGQSGVGKSSLLNAIEPGLALRVQAVSAETEKGKHTTTTAQLCKLGCGGYVVDTPGIRQFQLWDVIPAEVAGYFRDLRPFVNLCQYPNCTHTHEHECAVKHAVADGLLDSRRYDSYCHMYRGDMA